MAQLALGLVGAGVGSVFGYASLGWSVGAALGGFLFPEKKPDIKNQGPRLNDLTVQSSAYGSMIPHVFGTVRLAGNIINASDIRESSIVIEEEVGGKGGGGQKATTEIFVYHVDLWIAVCMGGADGIDGFRRIWQDGRLIFDAGETVDHFTLAQSYDIASTIRFYRGTSDQLPDPTFEALRGVGNVPGYVGIAGISLTNFEVSAERGIPNLTFEVVRTGGSGSTSSFLTLPALNGVSMAGSDQPVVGRDGRSVYWQGGNPADVMTSYGDRYVSAPSDNITGAYGLTQRGKVIAVARPDNKLLIFERGRKIGERAIVGSQFEGVMVSRPGGGRVFVMGNFDNGVTSRLGMVDEYAFPVQVIGGPPIYGGGGFVLDVSEQETCLGVDTAATGSEFTYWLGEVRGLAYVPIAETSSGLVKVSGELPDCRAFMHSPTEGVIYAVDNLTGELYTWDESSGALLNQFSIGPGYPVATRGWSMARDEDGVIYALKSTSEIQLWRIADAEAELMHEWTGESANLGSYYFSRFAITRQKVIYAGSGVRAVPYDQLARDGYSLRDLNAEICELCGMDPSEIQTTELTDDTVPGYIIGSPSSGRACIQQLQWAFFYDEVDTGTLLRFVSRGQSPALEIDHAELAAHAFGEPVPPAVNVVRMQDVDLPRELRVVFIDRDTDYLVGTQPSRRLIGTSDRVETIELPIVLTNAAAKRIADTNHFAMWRERQRVSFRTSYEYAELEPTDVIDIVGERTNHRVRLVKRNDDGMRISWEGVNEDHGDYDFNPVAETPREPESTVTIPVPPELFVLDIPILRPEDDHPGVYGAISSDFETDGALVYRSADDVTYEQKALATTIAAAGWCVNILGDHANPHVSDEGNAIELFLLGGSIEEASYDDCLDSNANIAVVGREIVQFRHVTGYSGNTFRLTGLRRGRLGTEHECRLHLGGEQFVILRTGGSVFNMALGQGEIGLDRYWKAVGFNELISRTPAILERFNCVRLKPRSPVLDVLVRDELNDEWEFEGSRRTRYNGQWAGSGDVPLNESYEQYVIRWFGANEKVIGAVTYGETTLIEVSGSHGFSVGDEVYIFSASNLTFLADTWGEVVGVAAVDQFYINIDTRGRTTTLSSASGRLSKKLAERTLASLTDTLTLAEQGGVAATRVGVVVTQISEAVGEGFPLVAQRTQA